MKRTVIGSVLTLAGTGIIGCLFIAAVLFVPNMSSWEGTRVWYAIFGSGTYEADLKQSMALGLPFTIGVLIFVLGIVILAIEYFRPEARRDNDLAPLRPTGRIPAAGAVQGNRPASTVGDNEEIPTMKEVGS